MRRGPVAAPGSVAAWGPHLDAALGARLLSARGVPSPRVAASLSSSHFSASSRVPEAYTPGLVAVEQSRGRGRALAALPSEPPRALQIEGSRRTEGFGRTAREVDFQRNSK